MEVMETFGRTALRSNLLALRRGNEMSKMRLISAVLCLPVLGCAVGGDVNTRYLTIDQKRLAYEVSLVGGSTHQLRIWRDGIVLAPDAVYERSLQMRGAEKAMGSVCGKSATPRILGVKLRTDRKAYTDLVFRCVSKSRKRKKKPTFSI